MDQGAAAESAGHDRDSLFEAAKAAAAAGDARAMLESLYRSGILDGIPRYIAARWTDFDFEDASLFVAAAVDRFYDKVKSGEAVRNVAAFLFKVALNKASDEYERKKRHVSVDEGMHAPAVDSEAAAGDLPRVALVHKAIELAKRFLPELGQESVQRVMALDLECIEKGIEDLPAKEAAAILNLSETTVRQSRSRGWRRLARVAKEHGVNLDDVLAEFQQSEEASNER